MSAKRRAQARRLAEAIAAGKYTPRPRRSHFRTVDIRDAAEGDVRAMRQQMAALRNQISPQLVTDEARVESRKDALGWAFRADEAEEPAPLTLISFGPARSAN